MSRHTLPISKAPIPKATPFWYADDFLIEMAEQSHKTAKTYRSGLRLFADWLQVNERGIYSRLLGWPLDPSGLNTNDVLDFQSWMVRNRSRGTANTYIMGVIGYLHYLEGEGLTPERIELGRLQRQMKRKKKKTGSEDVVALDVPRQRMPEVVEYYDAQDLPDDNLYGRRLTLLRNRALMRFMLFSAGRLFEVGGLMRSQVDAGQDQIVIIGKMDHPRTLHIDERAREAIDAYLAERDDDNPALWVSHSRNSAGQQLSTTSIHNVVKEAITELELDERLSAHDFRHYRATSLLRNGVPLEVVQEFLGHKDIATTRNIYAPVLGAHKVREWLNKV